MNTPSKMVGLKLFKQVVSCCLILGGLQLHSLYGQAENLDNVSTQNLVNKMKAMLGNGDLYGAIPYLNEFKKRAKDGEFDVKKLDKIDYFIGVGFMKGYTQKQDKNLLKKAAEQFEHYIKTYPSGADMHFVLINKVDCHRGTGDFKGAIKTLKMLLSPPNVGRLRITERTDAIEKLVQAYYFEEMWEEGMPWFESFLELTPDKEKKTMAAAALTEAYVAKEQFDKIEGLLPHLNTNTKSRFDPRLNYQFLQAGDHLASIKEYQKASLFYSLTMTPKEIVASYQGLLVEVTPRLKYYEGRQKRLGKDLPRYEATALNNLKIEHDTIKRKRDRVAEMLKTPDNDYTKDLRWRKATNYAAMGRDWEAFWGYMGLVTDYPKVDKDRRESYMYATFVQAEKIKKRDAAREIAARYLDNPEFQKYAYEVGLRLAAIYKDEAEKDLKLSETAETPPEAEAFMRESNASFDEMWAICTMLLEKKPMDKLANHVVFMMGSGWVARGENDESKWKELIDTFAKLLAKDYGAEKPDMLQGLHYWSALALLYQQKYSDAKPHFDAVFKDYPESDYIEDSTFRRGVCAKGMAAEEEDEEKAKEIWELARDNLNTFKEKYPRSKMRGEAEVFLGDIASAQENTEQAIVHYKQVVFGSEEGPITEDYNFIDYAVFEAGALTEAPETKEAYQATKELYEKYVEAHPDGDQSKALLEIARLLELMDDPREMFKRYYATIQEHGNNRNGLGVDDTLRKYCEKYYSYFDRFNDTFQFLNKLETDPAFRQEALSNRDNLFKAMREYPKMDKEVREKFSFDAGYRQELLSDTAPMKATLEDYKNRLGGLPPKPPEETFTQLLQESMTDGRDTLKYRLMMFLDNLYKEKKTSLKEENPSIEFPAFFDIPDFQKASPSSLLWMAEYNLETKGSVAVKKARVALVSIIKSFPNTPDGELPALMLLGEMEADGKSYEQAYALFKRAHDFFPASEQAKFAAVRQADMLRLMGEHTKAILLFKEVTRVSQWRGPVHAEATIKMGLCYYDQNDIQKAFPLFEAGYVLYGRYSAWAAQGYLYHARCLKKLGKAGEARSVVQASFKHPGVKESEWFDELNQEL